jgi:hypothetical protein
MMSFGLLDLIQFHLCDDACMRQLEIVDSVVISIGVITESMNAFTIYIIHNMGDPYCLDRIAL